MIIDSHVHSWRMERGDYDWMSGPGSEALEPIKRDFGAADLRPLIREAGVDRIVLVQAAATVAESEFLLRQAGETPEVAGVVGWVDIESAEAGETLERLAAQPAFKGVRPMIHDIPDVDWMLDPELAEAYRAIVRLDLTFDCLVRPIHLTNLLELLQRYPDMRAVICHAAKPEIVVGAYDEWARQMTLLARETGAFCKLSGLITEAGEAWTVDGLRPYVEHLLAIFGPARLIWGSDWPVLTLTASYGAWWDAVGRLLEELTPAERAQILGDNCAEAYRLG